ncbi:ribosome biogenesis protein BRX1 [Strigomonas culicis]|uniref:Ribosome biogenesis protein BRX1 n=1 Tax=Strigomonas culicis TaxID=28005 RepID=S9U9I0_9TRYP|nr:ribosome biogenesis protein BRX1 [Strigomonas culicis]|eukprot:EPY27422.1 ribosome biogenesis protein BRX1 [Strigomonas culicis]
MSKTVAPGESKKRPRAVDADADAEAVVAQPPAVAEESMVGVFQTRRATTDKRMTNRQKCLVLGGRSMSSKDRHLLTDLRGLMPHAREHAKVGRSHTLGDDLVDLCTLHQCNSFLFVEPHRKDVSYLWVGQAPAGPSLKLQLGNVHTADEVRMAGNCLKYSRPLLHFDRAFEVQPHLRVVKSLLQGAFNIPRYHPKSKPFVDRIMSFFWLDDHIWVRHYQLVPTEPLSLLEIGPRFTLDPVAIFNGVCHGKVLWRSGTAVSPTEQRRNRKLRRLEKHQKSEAIKEKSESHRARLPEPAVDPLDLVFKS